jgi:signal transduction histidine kinase
MSQVLQITPQWPAVLYVDDEPKALQYFRAAFEDEFVIYTASSVAEGYALLCERPHEIGVLLTDQRMPGERGVELLDKARKLSPNLVRLLVTAYTDYQAAIEAVNDGRISRYIHKPWDPDEMRLAILRAREQHQVLVEREILLTEKVETIRHMMMADKVASFGILAEGLNHHIRNALTVISAFVDMAPLKARELVDGTGEADANFWGELHEQTQAQIQRIQTLLMRLGEASDSTGLHFDDVTDLSVVLSDAMQVYGSFFQQREISVRYYVHPSVPKLHVNLERFRQLWRLLFTDLQTHLKAGDGVQIAAGPSMDASGRQVVDIVIDDTGTWPSDEAVENLFDPFFVRSQHPQELGVNLTACYVIVHLHGGDIQAMKNPSGGLRIHMTLPVDARNRPQDSAAFLQKLVDHEGRWRAREV